MKKSWTVIYVIAGMILLAAGVKTGSLPIVLLGFVFEATLWMRWRRFRNANAAIIE